MVDLTRVYGTIYTNTRLDPVLWNGPPARTGVRHSVGSVLALY